MFRITIAFIVAGIIVAGCNKPDNNFLLPKGVYSGTFKRFNQPDSQESNITLEFNYPSWSGSADINKYPALGTGTFKLNEGAIEFENKGFWTAEFDWTLILKGSYLERMEGDSLIFTKSYANGWVDVYKLKKDKRLF